MTIIGTIADATGDRALADKVYRDLRAAGYTIVNEAYLDKVEAELGEWVGIRNAIHGLLTGGKL